MKVTDLKIKSVAVARPGTTIQRNASAKKIAAPKISAAPVNPSTPIQHVPPRPGDPMQPGDPACPVREILAHVGDKWSTLVITNLTEGTLRFSDLKRRINGISQRMLTETVRSLERDGVLLRTIYPSIPPKVEYSLTPLGRTLVPLILALVHWALDHRPEIRTSRTAFDATLALPMAPIQQPLRR